MKSVARQLDVVRRPAIAVALGLLPLAMVGANAQTPGEVPYLNFPPVGAPAPPSSGSAYAPATPPPDLRSSQPPAAKGPSTLDTLKQRDQELSAIRAEQKRAVENEAKRSEEHTSELQSLRH